MGFDSAPMELQDAVLVRYILGIIEYLLSNQNTLPKYLLPNCCIIIYTLVIISRGFVVSEKAQYSRWKNKSSKMLMILII